MSKLFSPVSFRTLTLKNRIMVSPMCEYSSVDGFANDWHLVHLGSRAVGGAALVFTEATAVSAAGRISPDDLGIYEDEHIPQLQRIVSFIHSQGAYAGIQLAHAGRKGSHRAPWKGNDQIPVTSGGWPVPAPSAIPFLEGTESPFSLDIAGIGKIGDDFCSAARRARKAGFDIIELHAAHGYLMHEFLSPLSNHRLDAYGGNLENRMRLTLDIFSRVREVWPDELPVFVRISATDWVEGGWEIEQSVKLSNALKQLGADLVDCSSGGIIPGVNIPAVPGYQVPFAERIRKDTGLPTGALGKITSAQQAEDILEGGQADLIIMAREFLRDPYFPLHAAAILQTETPWPVQYLRAKS